MFQHAHLLPPGHRQIPEVHKQSAENAAPESECLTTALTMNVFLRIVTVPCLSPDMFDLTKKTHCDSQSNKYKNKRQKKLTRVKTPGFRSALWWAGEDGLYFHI